jgi:hypothetical protein
MNDGLHPLAFLDQQLIHLSITIDGQIRAPSGLDSARPGISPEGHFHPLHRQGLRTFPEAGQKPSKQQK